MTLRLEPVQVDTGSADEDGRLVFADGRLVAVLVRLSHEHDELAGRWALEALFRRLAHNGETFVDLDGAERWLHGQLVSALSPDG